MLTAESYSVPPRTAPQTQTDKWLHVVLWKRPFDIMYESAIIILG